MSEIIVPGGNGEEKKQEEFKPVMVVSVIITETGLSINFGQGVQTALISHALRLLSLQWDANLAMEQMKKTAVDNATKVQPAKGVIIGDSIMNRLRGGFGNNGDKLQG